MKSYAQIMEDQECMQNARIAELEGALRALIDACRNGAPGREERCAPYRTTAYTNARAVLIKKVPR